MISTVLERVERLAAERPNKLGLIAPDGELTFRDWVEESRSVAASLAARGVAVGDCVGIVLGNRHARTFTTVLTGIHMIGALAVPLNPRIGVAEFVAIRKGSDARVWFAADPALSRLKKGLNEPSEAEVVCVGCSASSRSRITRFDDFLEAANATPPLFEADLATPCTVAYTSGTTGAPKGVLWSHELLTLCAERMLDVFGEPHTGRVLSEQDVMQSPLPIFTGAMMANFLNVTMFTGCPLVLEDRFEPAKTEGLMARWGTTIYFAVPSIFALWSGSQARLTEEVRCLATGGARVAPDLVQTMHDRCKTATLLNLYGTVEAGAAMVVNAGDEMLRFPTSIGRPVPPTEIAIRDANGDVAPGDAGTLFVRSPGMMLGYRGDLAATDEVLQEGWLETPDVATMTGDGLIYLLGRKQETINRGGFKIMPNEVEQMLELHEGVAEAAVVSIPHPVLGEDIAAGIVLKAGSSLTTDEIRDFLNVLVADYKIPRTMRFFEALPRNHGKLDRSALRRDLLQS